MESVAFDARLLLALSMPFLLILVFMVGLKWSALKAGFCALLVTLTGLPFMLGISLWQLTTDIVPGSMLESAITSLSILWIIFAALCIYYAQMQSGAIAIIQQQLSRLHPDPRISALFIAWFFSMFMEGAAGFGTSAALTAPFLVAAGYRPVIAVVLALWGHSLGVAFGAVGTPVISQAILLDLAELSLSHAILPFWPVATWCLALGLTWGISRYAADGRETPAMQFPTIFAVGTLAALCFLAPAMAIAYLAGPELPTLLGALIGAACFVPMIRRLRPPSRSAILHQPLPSATGKKFAMAMTPYLILILLVLITRLIPDAKQLLQSLQWHFAWRQYSGSIQYFYHPGTMLLVSFVLGSVLQGLSLKEISVAGQRALIRVCSVLPALFVMLLLARLLVHSGAVTQLGQQVIAIAGASWPFWAPWFGVLGTFITGSATSSNILFSEFQRAAAHSAEVVVTPLLGAQTFGAAVGNMVCPHNIIAAGATVNIQGEEGKVMRYTLPMAVLLSMIGGVTALLLVT